MQVCASCKGMPHRRCRVCQGNTLRRCRRCVADKPAYSFLHSFLPRAREEKWPTSAWCGDCLLERGHITRHQLAAVVALEEPPEPLPKVLLSKGQHARVAEKIREHQIVTALLDRADDDLVFSRALTRAAHQHDYAQHQTTPRAALLARSRTDPAFAAEILRAAEVIKNRKAKPTTTPATKEDARDVA
jgi:hypothetical protein